MHGHISTHVQSNLLYHPFHPDVTHMRLCTKPSPAYLYCKRQKAGRGLGMTLLDHNPVTGRPLPVPSGN